MPDDGPGTRELADDDTDLDDVGDDVGEFKKEEKAREKIEPVTLPARHTVTIKTARDTLISVGTDEDFGIEELLTRVAYLVIVVEGVATMGLTLQAASKMADKALYKDQPEVDGS